MWFLGAPEATQVEIEMQSTANRITLIVRDNGRGFDQNQISEDGLGIQIMSERSNEINANLHVDSSPGNGTELSVAWEGE